ncbi:hypothetical protein [Janthinobacterium fluminis]|uniref:DUF4198 domain-containing protein n=1 Tax=Janthinobacterium fluminis TaxID=2987524 RepID=A0ABT5JWC6_9BURK|nr:hypothetical protein [Janthinobacterium fluminis]MDC8757037.1 hypothetical protein [Janthinobacterium fluminis]
MLKKMMVLSCIASAMSFAQAQSREPAGVDMAPISGIVVGKVKYIPLAELSGGAKKMVEADLATNALGKNKAYAQIPEEAVVYRKNYLGNVRDVHEVKRNLTFTLADLSGSAFDAFKFEGVVPEGPTRTGPWSSVSRYFKTPDGLLLILHEWDFVGDGGGVVIVKDLMNTRVADTPARFVVKKSPSGAVVSELIWVTESKYYTFTVMGEVASGEDGKYNLAWMNALAATLK